MSVRVSGFAAVALAMTVALVAAACVPPPPPPVSITDSVSVARGSSVDQFVPVPGVVRIVSTRVVDAGGLDVAAAGAQEGSSAGVTVTISAPGAATVGDTSVTVRATGCRVDPGPFGCPDWERQRVDIDFEVEVTAANGPPNGAVAIAAGSQHSCVVLADGTGRCWGANGSGELGIGAFGGASNVPVDVVGLADAVDVTAGETHVCAQHSDGSVSCWGTLDLGLAGNPPSLSSNVPVTVDGITGAVAVSAGRYHQCAVLADGTARCWGRNNVGQLGDPDSAGGASAVPVPVFGIGSAVDIAAGDQHSCAVLADGSARCWGNNSSGQLGNGGNTPSTWPVEVPGITNAVAIAAGGSYSCALLADGSARCWGTNGDGQLGNGASGPTAGSNVPVTVAGLTNAVDIAAGANGAATCAVLGDGTARCWGTNANGQLGNGTTTQSSLPVTVSGLSDAVAVTTDFSHSCALSSDGTARCWGSNFDGRLGIGTSDVSSNVPVPVVGIP